MEKFDKRQIPPGYYCYLMLHVLSDQVGMGPRILRKPCPFLEGSDHGVVYCRYLEHETGKPFGAPIADDADSYAKALAYYGSEEALAEATPGILLFDGCKECGENDQYEAESEEEMERQSEEARDEYVRLYGFQDFEELADLMKGLPLATEEDLGRYREWVRGNFGKEALLALLSTPPAG